MSRKLGMFNNVSLDGYFTDADGDMSFAKPQGHDDEHLDFIRQNARGGSVLVFGRVTYEMMASFWPTDMAQKMMPEMAKTMNASPKLVFSRTLRKADWSNTTLLSGDPATEIARLKRKAAPT
jgi:dihydrofolate reductase